MREKDRTATPPADAVRDKPAGKPIAQVVDVRVVQHRIKVVECRRIAVRGAKKIERRRVPGICRRLGGSMKPGPWPMSRGLLVGSRDLGDAGWGRRFHGRFPMTRA